MKSQYRISGKKISGKELTPEQLKAWSFERRPGGWVIGTLVQNGIEKRIRFSYERAKNYFWTQLEGHHFFGEKIAVGRAGHATQSASDLTAQFPGKVRKILVAQDQQVEAGTPLLMVEAMKMEFAIKAQAKGTVKKILVNEGDQLAPGQLLIDFEETK